MGNCLITKLKENVNNDNLVNLGHFKLSFLSDIYGILGSDTVDVNIRSVSDSTINRLVLATNQDFIKHPGAVVIDVDNKYDINYFIFNGTSVDMSPLSYSPLNVLINYENPIRNNLEEVLKSSVGIKELYINDSGYYGNISCLSGKLGNAEFNNGCTLFNTELTGDAAVFLECPATSGKTINIQNTGITTTQATIDALAANGYTLICDSSQIVE